MLGKPLQGQPLDDFRTSAMVVALGTALGSALLIQTQKKAGQCVGIRVRVCVVADPYSKVCWDGIAGSCHEDSCL